MLRSYILTSFRNLMRNKAYTAINMLGLGLGLAIFLLLAQYVAHESAANKFNPHYNRLYRVQVMNKEGKADYHLPPGYAPLVQQQFPAVEQAVRFAEEIGGGTIERPEIPGFEALRDSRILYADSGFLNAFAFPLLRGSAGLAAPNTLALSERMAEKLFGTDEALNKTLLVRNQFGANTFRVTAVYRQPEPSDVQADLVLSLTTLASAAGRGGNDWADPAGTGSGYASIYLQLRPGSKGKELGAQITAWVRSINPDSKEDQVYLQPMSELHIAPSFSYPYHTYGSLTALTVFAAIAVLILVIAWVNYINLSIAQSLKRAKEIGVRKVLGASRGQLVRYYLTETALLTGAGLGIALVLASVAQEPFNRFVDKELSLGQLAGSPILLFVIGLTLLGAALSGSYSGWVLTSTRAVQTLQNKVRFGGRGLSLGKGMLVFQFFISSLLLIGTGIIYQQLRYMRSKPLGMDLEQRLVINGPSEMSKEQKPNTVAFKQALAALPFVQQLSASNNVPGKGFNFTANGITGATPQKGDEQKPYNIFIGDENFFSTYGIRFLQGAAFTRADAEAGWSQTRKLILNESAARSLGFKTTENLLGRKVLWGEPYEIVGLIPDYHHLSLKEPITPAVYLAVSGYRYFTLQLRTDDLGQKLTTIRNLFRQFFPGQPFDYFFASEQFNRQYQSDEQLGLVFLAAAGATVFIASIGLLGLVAFSTRQRTKEIGIRKILGASVQQILALISKEFLRLVLIAFLLAAPVAWWAAHTWLQDFAYRTDVSWWLFVGAGLFAMLLALGTIVLMALRAVSGSQVRNLRSE